MSCKSSYDSELLLLCPPSSRSVPLPQALGPSLCGFPWGRSQEVHVVPSGGLPVFMPGCSLLALPEPLVLEGSPCAGLKQSWRGRPFLGL